jgi:hypothetical protein
MWQLHETITILTVPGFSHTTISSLVQYATTDLTHIVFYCYGFTLLKERMICKLRNLDIL